MMKKINKKDIKLSIIFKMNKILYISNEYKFELIN